jgi:hypothetical protein
LSTSIVYIHFKDDPLRRAFGCMFFFSPLSCPVPEMLIYVIK